jgi:uncharacterized protein YukE
MADEFVARYQGESHKELYRQLMAGDPDQVQGLAAHWRSLNDTVTHLAGALDKDLAALGPSWDSDAGTEFQHRVSLVSSFSTALGGDFSTMSDTLTTMAGPLREAKKKAEDPADTDNNDKAFKDGAIGTLVAGPVGGLVGGLYGHHQDEEEKQKAAERMVQLVAGLASTYATRSSAMPIIKPEPHGLPGKPKTGTAKPSGVGKATTVGKVGHGDQVKYTTTTGHTPTQVSHGPTSGSGTDDHTGAGAGPTPGTITDGTLTDGSTTVGPGQGPTSLLGSGDLTGATGGGLGGLLGTGTGGLGSGAGMAGLAGAAGVLGLGGLAVGGLAGARTPAGEAGLGSSSSTSTGAAGARGLFPSGSQEGNAGLSNGNGKAAAGLTRRSGSGTGRGHEEEDEVDERVTWLTEDNMDWSGTPTPPPVLGATRTAEEEGSQEEPRDEQV